MWWFIGVLLLWLTLFGVVVAWSYARDLERWESEETTQ